MTTQAGIEYLKSLSSVSSSSNRSSDLAIINASTATSVKNITTTRYLAPLTLEAAASVSAASAMPTPPSRFTKDVNPVPFVCQLPGPNDSLQTTRQLAYSLAVLQALNHEDDLSSDTLKWRHRTLDSSEEKDRLETLAVQILKEFADETMKDAATVAEVVQLSPVLDINQSRFLLNVFIDAVNGSEMLQFYSLEGLAKVIQGAAPRSIDSNDLVTILRTLHKRLRFTHSASHRYRLLLAVSRVLDAMADAHVGDVDRIDLHEPLTELLRESELGENPYLTFQAAYATQALLNVSDNEDIWQAGFRRGWLILKGGAGFAKMPDPKEVKDALEGLEKLYKAGKGGVRMLKDVFKAIRTREMPTFTVKEGLKFKRAWYRALRIAESYIQTGKLVQFKELVTTSPCRHQPMFQWGICHLLGRFAADTHWDLGARIDAIVFLKALYQADSIWTRQKEVDQVISDALTNVVSKDGTHFEGISVLRAIPMFTFSPDETDQRRLIMTFFF